MIYFYLILINILLFIHPVESYINSINILKRKQQYIPKYFDIKQYYKDPNEIELKDADNDIEYITVRFINTPSGKDVIANNVEKGSNLLAIGDQHEVKLPRACRTGLCGSCTCEVAVPGAIATNPSQKDGFVTIRACSAKCYVPEGMNEMIIDVERMRNMSEKKTKSTATKGLETKIDFIDPMARFSGDWEKEFKPMWELNKEAEQKSKNLVNALQQGQQPCTKCKGIGRVTCYACNGVGKINMGSSTMVASLNNKSMQCPTCVGMHTTGCGYCRSTGFISKRK